MMFLVVDDSPVVTQTLRKTLQREGYDANQIHTASSGEEGLAMFEALNPDVVFLDVQMPGLDGEQTAAEMTHEDPEVRVIVITGMGPSDDRVRRMVAAGAFKVLEKPIHSEDLEEVLQLIERETSGAGRIH